MNYLRTMTLPVLIKKTLPWLATGVRHCHGWRPQTLQLSDGSLLLPLNNPSLFYFYIS